jgi:RNA polymerase sigma factor (sigma-70 family)
MFQCRRLGVWFCLDCWEIHKSANQNPKIPLLIEPPAPMDLEPEVVEALHSALDLLPERYQQVVELRFGFTGDKRTLQQVGDKLGITRERVRQIEAGALRRMRHPENIRRLTLA